MWCQDGLTVLKHSLYAYARACRGCKKAEGRAPSPWFDADACPIKAFIPKLLATTFGRITKVQGRHLMLNGAGTNIGNTLAGGESAKPKVLKAVKAELSKPKYNAYRRIRESSKQRDVRPNDPECRKLLFTPGLRYGVTVQDQVRRDCHYPTLCRPTAALDTAHRGGACHRRDA